MDFHYIYVIKLNKVNNDNWRFMNLLFLKSKV